MKTTWSIERFIIESKQIHHDTYDYSEAVYIYNYLPVKIICKYHGVFEQTPHNHLKGRGCKYCANNVKLTTCQFIERAKKIHKNKFDYSVCEYINSKTPVKIICKNHGEFFVFPSNHLKGTDCMQCSDNDRSINQRLPKQVFVDRSNKIHNNFYIYDNVVYINEKLKVEITCPNHGQFEQKPDHHMRGVGCPKCKISKGEKKIIEILNNKKISFEFQKIFDDCINPNTNSKLRFDFYLPNYNLCIEFDGQQHYKEVAYFGGKPGYLKIKEKDKLKDDYCKLNNIKLARVKYNENINAKIIKLLNF